MEYTGTHTLHFDNGIDEVSVDVSFKYYFDSGRMYMSNGDPGYPPEESLDILEVHGDCPEWITDEMITDNIYENLQDFVDLYYED
jgi:hypothetical protein